MAERKTPEQQIEALENGTVKGSKESYSSKAKQD